MKLNLTATAPKNEDGSVNEEAIQPREVEGGGGQISWDIIPAGLYPSIVVDIAEKVYQANYAGGSVKNPDTDDGRWDYYAVTPKVHVPHYSEVADVENVETAEGVMQRETTRSVIDYITGLGKQDLTVCVLKNNTPYRVQQDGKSPLFRGNGGAFDMFTALGLFSLDGTNVVIKDDMEVVRNRVVWTGIRYAAYAKRANGATLNWDADSKVDYKTGEIKKAGFAHFIKNDIMNDIEVSPEATDAWNEWASTEKWETRFTLPLNHLLEIVNTYNAHMEAEWGSVEDGYGIRAKNVVTFWGAMTKDDAEKRGYYYHDETKQVFVSEEDYNTYLGLSALSDNSSALDML